MNETKRMLPGDKNSICLLLLLYTLQGVPMGLASIIPLLLQENGASYADQGLFSLVSWPFSLKLLWAPIVDGYYHSRFGRRKSWLIPVQLICGLMMILISSNMNDAIGNKQQLPNVSLLTGWFFVLYFLMATQDIAVDGWAITILSRENVGWASTCNAIGQSLGSTVGFVVFMSLNSPEFCNMYLRREPKATGLVTLGSFVAFWGWVFVFTTLAVWLGKSERSNETEVDKRSYEMVNGDEPRRPSMAHSDELCMGVQDTYKAMVEVLKKPAVVSLTIVLLTSKVGFAAADSVTSLKLQERGLPKEQLAILGMVMSPIPLILPAVISKYTCGERPLGPFMRVVPYRLAVGGMFMLLLSSMPHSKGSDDSGAGGLRLVHYAGMAVCFLAHQVVSNVMYVSQMAFFARVADPHMGGTYMTLLNTLANLGVKWPSTAVLALVDPLTLRWGDGGVLDGYYVTSGVCTAIGVGWWVLMRRRVQALEEHPSGAWRIAARESGGGDDELESAA